LRATITGRGPRKGDPRISTFEVCSGMKLELSKCSSAVLLKAYNGIKACLDLTVLIGPDKTWYLISTFMNAPDFHIPEPHEIQKVDQILDLELPPLAVLAFLYDKK